MNFIYNFFIYIFLFSLTVSCNSSIDYKKIKDTSINYTDGYAGDENCKSCHETEYNSWRGSHHDLAMMEANDSTVLGDFNDLKTIIDGVKYHFYKQEDRFLVKIDEIDETEKVYQIEYTFGITPLQQYLVDFDKGRKQVLRVTWDTEKHQWFHQYAEDKIVTHDWLHWTNGGQNWNTMCAECHSTNLKKNYFVEKDSFHTTYSSINVSCEACHGPGEEHILWADTESEDKDHKTYNAISQGEIVNMCAPCHARRVKLTKNLNPGNRFEDQYLIQTLITDFYHGDGQIEEEDYVFGSFFQSKMYANGIKCTDCHDAHTMQLKFEGNKLCNLCHVITDYDTKKHHFHEEGTEAGQCINCHMTGKYYMGNDFRRDHSFRIPRPDQSVEYNTPNACTGCHQDKTDRWAEEAIKKWYGPKRQPHFSDALLLSSRDNLNEEDRKILDAFVNDLNYPVIARATVIDNLDYTTNEQYQTLLKALKDSSALIRYKALDKFRYLPLQDRIPLALEHMTDSVKLVRIAAAQLSIGFDENNLNDTVRTSLLSSRRELENMLYSNADFSTGRVQLGDYYLQKNDLNLAIKHYEMALQKDSLLAPVYSNLATAYSMTGNNSMALKTFENWMKRDATQSRPYYLRALLYFELKENEKAVSDLERAIQLNPRDTRSMYNLATYYFQDKKDLSQAEKNIKKALKIEPDNTEYKYLLALIYRDQGKFKSGQKILNELRENQTN